MQVIDREVSKDAFFEPLAETNPQKDWGPLMSDFDRRME
jgi:hypothetical protein